MTPRRIARSLLRSRAVAGATISAAARAARRAGAPAEILEEATSARDTRHPERTLQILAWSRRVIRGAPLRSFSPGDHLSSPPARAAAADLLRRRLATGGDGADVAAIWRRQLIAVDDRMDRQLLAEEIAVDLRALLSTHARTGRDDSVFPPETQRRIVREVAQVLERAGLRPFVMTGTLLGLVRDGDFMAHDYDIDIGLPPTDDVDVARRALAQLAGYTLHEYPNRIVLLDASGARTDVFPHWLRDGRLWHGTAVHEWWNTPFELTRRDFGDLHLWVPEDTDRYLDECYGDWSRPVAFYDITFDTPNRRYLDGAEALRFLHSRVVIGLREGDRWLVEASLRNLRDHFGVDAVTHLAPTPLLDPQTSFHGP